MSPFVSPSYIIAILIAVSIHEWAHGYVAYRLGDPTAKYAGRLTINPLAHLDLLGTLMFFIVGFGWAKPVPVDPRYFKKPKRDVALVALAGPAINLVLAIVAFIGLTFLGKTSDASAMDLITLENGGSPVILLITQILAGSLFINLALMAFNLLPIAPLDGSKIIHPFIPLRYDTVYWEFMQKGPLILLAVIVVEQLMHIPILSAWVFGIVNPILHLMFSLV